MNLHRGERGAMHLLAVVGLTVGSLALALLAGVILPSIDSAVADAPGTARTYSSAQVEGRKIYVREGCITCHTQMVRDAEADIPLGLLSQAGLYDNEAPNLIGLDRIGPDLTCVGGRFDGPDQMTRFLANPRSVHKGSDMPKYAFLTGKELGLLADYLLALQCGGK